MTLSIRRLSIPVLALFALLLSTAASAQQNIQFNVAVTGGVASVSATVHENPKAPHGSTVLALHGFTETAATWEPLIDALFSHPATKFRVKRVIALDLPGHGNSPIPVLASGLFGNLTIYDNVAVLLQSIEVLRARGLGPRVLLGHSMGGLEIQSAQEQLLVSGSSLAKKGVLRAILLAPVPVANVPGFMPSQAPLPPQYLRNDNGTYIVLDRDASLVGGGFTTLAGTIIPAAFTLDFTGLIGAEPLFTALQLVGALPGVPRPSARQGAFALKNGTLLTVVGFSEDVLTPAALQEPLYEHLIGRRGLMYQEVVAPDAVHSMFITNPEGLLDQLFGFSDMF